MRPANPTRSTLDLFLLALIRDGVSTLYELREHAGLSVGGTKPALQRLENDKLIEGGSAGVRNKQTYILTAAGRKILAVQLRAAVEFAPMKPYADTESILRLVTLCSHEDSTAADELLNRAAHERRARATGIRAKISGSDPIAQKYRNLVADVERSRLLAEASRFENLRKLLTQRRRRTQKRQPREGASGHYCL